MKNQQQTVQELMLAFEQKIEKITQSAQKTTQTINHKASKK